LTFYKIWQYFCNQLKSIKMKFKNFFKNNTRMTTENPLNEEIVDQTPIENNENNSDSLETTIEERVEEITKEEQLSQDLASEKDKFLRLFAEFENYKRRTTKERIELYKTANQDVLLALLPVLDDFDRALAEIKKTDDNILIKGVELIQEKLKSTLFSKGLEEVEIKAGDAFDADFAEAITQIPAPSPKMKGKIVDVIEKGYKLGDKIIRFPKVVIGN
jgi:molecular chaperone GrpE